jgi:hypothetical protein
VTTPSVLIQTRASLARKIDAAKAQIDVYERALARERARLVELRDLLRQANAQR